MIALECLEQPQLKNRYPTAAYTAGCSSKNIDNMVIGDHAVAENETIYLRTRVT